MLSAVHLRLQGFTGAWPTHLAEAVVAGVGGVVRVAGMGSLGLVSVMFDDSVTSAERIISALHRVGLDARVLSGS